MITNIDINTDFMELEFLKEALETVIKSKRVLKNTYIFGYYLKDGNEKKLFEYSGQKNIISNGTWQRRHFTELVKQFSFFLLDPIQT